jgi:plasmid stabilization system protein ParE
LDAIEAYVAQDDPEAATRVRDAIVASVGQLSRHPFLGAEYRRRRGAPGIRELLSGNYRIFYTVLEDQSRVEIHHVRHARREEPKHL